MKHVQRLIVVVLGLGVTLAPAAFADVINGGFEDGSPLSTSWNVRGTVQVVPVELGNLAFFEEPGTGGVSQIWQSVDVPTSANFLTFRYRFQSPRDSVAPKLLAVVSRKTHGITNPVTIDLDVLGNETECRSDTIGTATTTLTIVAKFDRRVSLLGLPGGDVMTDHGQVDVVDAIHDTVTIEMSGVERAARVNLSLPGVTDWTLPTAANATRDEFCVVVEVGDYDGDGQTTDDDVAAHLVDFPTGSTVVSFDSARADVNLDGVVDQWDRDDINALPLPLAAMGCPFNRPLGSASPPDSFVAYLLTDDDSGDLPAGFSLTNAPFYNAFFYHDSNGSQIVDPKVMIASDVDSEGLFAVTVGLGNIADGTPTRVVFALTGAANGRTSAVVLDDVAFDCPPGWCCNETTGLGGPIDDGDACTLETCNQTTGEITQTFTDTEPPVITCPADTVVVDRTKRGPEHTGYATATDNCSDPTITDPPRQFVHLGCPTVINRFWDATDASSNTDECTQVITDLDSDAPFYFCLEQRLRECYTPPKTCKVVDFLARAGSECRDESNTDIVIDSLEAAGCTCSVAENLTECFRQVITGALPKGQIQSCVAHYSTDLVVADLICQNDKGGVNSCVAGQLELLIDWLRGDPITGAGANVDDCNGGPIGTDVCILDADCQSDFDLATNDCCVRAASGDPTGWCEYLTTQCPAP